MRVKLKKVSREFDNKVRDVVRMSGESVSVGWFLEQGLHTPSGLPLPKLVAIHHNGINVPKRPILSVVAHLVPPNQEAQKIKAALQMLVLNPKETDKALSLIGGRYVEVVKSYFGSSFLQPNDGNPNPLIDTGELKNSTSYKTSITKKVKNE